MVLITSFRKCEKNGTLRGFFDVRLTDFPVEIKDFALHENHKSKWIYPPAKFYEKDGRKNYYSVVEFYDNTQRLQFQNAVLKALEKYMSGSDMFERMVNDEND